MLRTEPDLILLSCKSLRDHTPVASERDIVRVASNGIDKKMDELDYREAYWNRNESPEAIACKELEGILVLCSTGRMNNPSVS